MLENISETEVKLILALISSSFFGYIVKDIYLHVRDWLKSKSENPFTRVLPKIHEIYQIINSMLGQLDCKIILIVKTENGGGTPRLDAKITGTIIYEAFNSPSVSMKASLQKEELDYEYIKLLCQLDINNTVELSIWELQNSILKSVLGSNKITSIKLFKICKTDKKFIHLIIGYPNLIPEQDLTKTELIRQSISKLKNIFLSEELL
jgi:hypothetical protein